MISFKSIFLFLNGLFLLLSTSWAWSQPVITIPNLPSSTIPSSDSSLLVIGVDSNTPPYVIQGGLGQLYGYDISMMNYICLVLKRTCQFKPMKWMNLIPALMNNEIDLAVSDITITPERAKKINFSLPYALSYSRFLTNVDNSVPNPFQLNALDGKRIGVDEGTIYEEQINHMGIKNLVVVTYPDDDEGIKALTNKDIDYLLLDNPTALYWASNSSGTLKVIGKPYSYGYGAGIGISNAAASLMPAINQALLQYQNSNDYKENYKRYLDFF